LGGEKTGVNDSQRRRAREAELRSVDLRLHQQPEDVELLFKRAKLLDALGGIDEAREGYVEVLKRDATHFAALNDFGMLLYRAGYTADARTCYAAAVAHHPENAIGHANFALTLLKGGEAQQAREHYEIALRLDPTNVEAHRGLTLALTALGEHAEAEQHRTIGFAGGAVTSLPYRGEGPPIPLLLLVSETSGNVHTERLIDDRIFQTFKVVIEHYDGETTLPQHALIFNALGDADVCAAGLEIAAKLTARSGAPIVNPPAAIAATGRAANAARLRTLPGVVAANMVPLPRDLLAGPEGAAAIAAHGFRYPVLLRTPGYHTGQHFLRVDAPDRLAGIAADLPGDELLVIEYLDVRRADGKIRKYRAIVVGERLYPLHLAIADHWKVHYFSADMADRPEHRAEDAAFLEDMATALGPDAMAALGGVQERLGLDYAGIDFSLDRAGNVAVFEANATMVVPAPKADERWAYRRDPAERIIEAVRTMLIERSRSVRGIS
jgi:glutathione synthase/RimK-type ligase-like ATP-grasp enzyme